MWFFYILAYLITIVSWSWLNYIAFKDSFTYGLLFTFVPLYCIYYIVIHWEKCAVPVYMHLAGWLIFIILL